MKTLIAALALSLAAVSPALADGLTPSERGIPSVLTMDRTAPASFGFRGVTGGATIDTSTPSERGIPSVLLKDETVAGTFGFRGVVGGAEIETHDPQSYGRPSVLR